MFRGVNLRLGKFVYGNLKGTATEPFIENEKGNFEVLSSTLGEFTGIYDADGCKIFEGDVVNLFPELSESGSFAVVGYSDGGFRLRVKKPINDRLSDFQGKTKVVGNIVENPDFVAKCLPSE